MVQPSDNSTNKSHATGASLPPVGMVYPAELAEKERRLIEARRQDLNLSDSAMPIGVALSGGGIRSATFCLGLFQSLARRDLLKRIDYLSTVSGGGYFGGFFGKLFQASGESCTPASIAARARDALADNQSPSLNWLRENGRYIAPHGGGDYFFAASTYLRNWAAVQYALGITLLTLFLITNTLRAWAWSASWGAEIELIAGSVSLPRIWASPWLLFPTAIGAFILIPLGAAYWLTQKYQRVVLHSKRRNDSGCNYPLLGIFVLGSAAVTALVASNEQALAWVPKTKLMQYGYAYVVIASILSLAGYFIAGIKAPSSTKITITRNRLSRWLSQSLLLFLFLALFGLVDSVGQTIYAMSTGKFGTALFTGFATGILVLLVRQFACFLSLEPGKTSKIVRIPAHVIGFGLGILLALIVATFWSAVAHAVLWEGKPPHGDPGQLLAEYYAPKTPNVSLSLENYIVVTPWANPSSPAIAATSPAATLVTSACIITLLISFLTGKTLSFLNLSSIQEFYSSRLSRAYLGASNPRRTGFGMLSRDDNNKGNGKVTDVTTVVPHDDMTFSDYHPEAKGGPIHLINVTINETVAGPSQLEQRDRKGMGMAAGPEGISVARVHHAIWCGNNNDKLQELCPIHPDTDRYMVFNKHPTNVESLTLGQWVAISGAAFSTGLGARTNLGMSLLLGLSNVRIGYWWNSGISPRKRRKDKTAGKQKAKISDWLEPIFSTQVYMSDEFLARFHGPHRQRWYLTDGGHFENTGAYELVRRRLPLIIVSDNGCDPQYRFEDIANLIRKVRIDFGAEIRFLDEEELNQRLDPMLRRSIGTPAELQRRATKTPSPAGNQRLHGAAYSNCHALLAHVYYDGNAKATSLLLVIKPSLTGDEPLDLLEYHAQQPEFPQETTLDQFFDEAQWESYRKLGADIGEDLFDAIPSLDEWTRKMLD